MSTVPNQEVAGMAVSSSDISPSDSGSVPRIPALIPRILMMMGIGAMSVMLVGAATLVIQPMKASSQPPLPSGGSLQLPEAATMMSAAPDVSQVALMDVPQVRLQHANQLYDARSYAEAADAYRAVQQSALDVQDLAVASLAMRREAVSLSKISPAQFDTAAKLLEQSMAFNQRNDLKEHFLQDKIALAGLLIDREAAGDEAQALTLLNDVADQALKESSLDRRILNAADLRISYLERKLNGNVEASLASLLRVEQFYGQSEDFGAQADADYRIAERYIDLMQWDNAQTAVARSRELWDRMSVPVRQGWSRAALKSRADAQQAYARALELSGDFDDALLARKPVTLSDAALAELAQDAQRCQKSFAALPDKERTASDVIDSVAWPCKFSTATLTRLQGQSAATDFTELQQDSRSEAKLLALHGSALSLLAQGQTDLAVRSVRSHSTPSESIFLRIPLLKKRILQLQQLTRT